MPTEGNRDSAGLTIAVLSHNNVSLTGAVFLLIVFRAVQQHNQVRILFQRARLTQVTHLGLAVGAVFRATVKLSGGNHRNLQLLSQQLQGARKLRNFLLTRLHAAPTSHQLQIVNNNQTQVELLL